MAYNFTDSFQSTLRATDTVPQAVHLPTGSSLSHNTNLEPCNVGKGNGQRWKFKQRLKVFDASIN